jgi:hypothetical protein
MAVPQTARGKLVQCPQCRKRIRIPLLVQTPTLDDAAANAPSAPPTPIPKSKSA